MKVSTPRDVAAAMVLAAAAALLVGLSTVRRGDWYTRGDPYGSLLVSQAILEQGSVSLDPYGSPGELARKYAHAVYVQDGRMYHFFPLGTPVLALPFVAVANALSLDMTDPADDSACQGWLAALTVALSAIGSYLLCRIRLGMGRSLLLAFLFVFGTSLISTCGVALWSFDFEVPLVLAALLLLLRPSGRPRGRWARAFVLGTLLFLAYMCRPTAAALVVPLAVYLLLTDRPLGLRLLIVLAFWALVMGILSLGEYGSLLPPYYRPGRLGSPDFLRALAGNLVSPSRGLLVFSPFFVPVLVMGILRFGKDSARLAMLFSWLVLEVLLVSTFPHWWGGHSFGPRLLTDAVPAVLAIAALTAPAGSEHRSRAYWIAVIILGLASVAIHSAQGLFNSATARWNRPPDVDVHPRTVFDWDYPQFCITDAALRRRMADVRARKRATRELLNWLAATLGAEGRRGTETER
ncbi:hypothetical protein GF402_11640 [Candidatus Fermentibacteria bacterium]|nr:hypothetical protein [Candidatus Fermentibacteria bacterium]